MPKTPVAPMGHGQSPQRMLAGVLGLSGLLGFFPRKPQPFGPLAPPGSSWLGLKGRASRDFTSPWADPVHPACVGAAQTKPTRQLLSRCVCGPVPSPPASGSRQGETQDKAKGFKTRHGARSRPCLPSSGPDPQRGKLRHGTVPEDSHSPAGSKPGLKEQTSCLPAPASTARPHHLPFICH